jgi:hypothetical protein
VEALGLFPSPEIRLWEIIPDRRRIASATGLDRGDCVFAGSGPNRRRNPIEGEMPVCAGHAGFLRINALAAAPCAC